MSPLSTACTSVIGTVGFGRRLDAGEQLNARFARPQRDHDAREEFVTAAVEYRHGVADAESQHPPQVFGFVLREDDRLIAGVEGRSERIDASAAPRF